ncbi:MAG: acetylglutamate kinase [Candidatus Atribacteria bacterium]|nr:acetylglutamate kinase [Candidatus Atribacteria bacterium]
MKIVLKLSGKNISPHDDVISLPVLEVWNRQVQIAVIHGGGPQISQTMEKMGRIPQFIEGLRVTADEDMDIAEMVLSGLLNKMLVGMLWRRGVPACGLSGRDGGLFLAHQHQVMKEGIKIDLGRVGDIQKVDPRIVQALWFSGFLPVISPVSSDGNGNALNVNADWAAANLAVSLGVDRLLLFTDVPGVLADPGDPSSLFETLSVRQIPRLINDGVVTGGMVPKLQMVESVIRGGVGDVFITGGNSLPFLGKLLEGGTIPGTRITG